MAATVDPIVDLPADVDALLDDPARTSSWRSAAARRDAAHGARITFSPKVFIPLTMLCRDKCGYCTFAKPPAHLVSPYLELDEVLAIARRGAELGCHEALFTLGEAPEDRYPDAAAWLAARGYSLDRRLPRRRGCRRARRDRSAPPRQRRCAERGRARPAPGGVAVAGDDDRDPRRARWASPAARTPARPTRPPHVAWPRSRPPGRARVPFTTGILVGIGETRRERLDALARHRRRPRPPRPRAGGDRPELPAQDGHLDVARARLPARRVPLDHRRRPPGARPVDPPAGAAQPLRCRRPRGAGRRRASTTGAASRRSPPTTSTPSGRGPDSTCCATATEATGHTLAPRLTVYSGVRARRRPLAARRRALRGAVRVRPRRTRARRRVGRRW